MRTRAFRRHQAARHMWRRLKEDRNQHDENLACPCWTDPKAMARFKEQPKQDCRCCKNPRRFYAFSGSAALRRTMQERRFLQCEPELGAWAEPVDPA